MATEYEYEQLCIRRETPALWWIRFDHPPTNLVNPQTLRDLDALVSEMEGSGDLKVVVLDSADPHFFLGHWDIAARPDASAPSWIDIALRLARVHVISIALIRGRARGMGSEIALACDMRFAGIERAILGRPEVGAADFDAMTGERYGWIDRALPELDLDPFVMSLARRIASLDKAAVADAKRIPNRLEMRLGDHLQGDDPVTR